MLQCHHLEAFPSLSLGSRDKNVGEQSQINSSLILVGPAEAEANVGVVDKDIFGHIFGLEALSMSLALADT